MITSVVFLLFVIVVLFGRHIFYRNSDLNKIPGPWCYPILGSAIRYLTTANKVIPVLDDAIKDYGRIFLLWMFHIPVLNIAEPNAVEAILTSKSNIRKGRAYNLLRPWLGRGLLTSSGERWFSHRRLITPTFHFSILETYLKTFQENSRILVNQLNEVAKQSEPIYLQPYITRCTLDIICETAMGTKINAQKQSVMSLEERDELTSSYVNSIFKIAELTTKRVLNVFIRPSFIFFRLRIGKAYKKHLKIVQDFTKNVISSRKAAFSPHPSDGEKRRPAFLDLLLESCYRDGAALSDEDVREEVDTFMFEGHDTTSAAIIWALYLLGKHQEVQEEIYEELRNIFDDDEDRSVTLKELAEMKKLERAIKETLRLYPSVPSVSRTIDEDVKIGDYKIPEGTSILVHIYHLHRDPSTFPDPESFNPDRFTNENSAKRHPFSYIPFSAGQRNCIGQKFALQEEKIVLSSILRTFRVSVVGELEKTAIRHELILRPPPSLRFRLIRR